MPVTAVPVTVPRFSGNGERHGKDQGTSDVLVFLIYLRGDPLGKKKFKEVDIVSAKARYFFHETFPSLHYLSPELGYFKNEWVTNWLLRRNLRWTMGFLGIFSC